MHGLSATAAHWAPVATLKRSWGTVVAPDLPGFGRTPLAVAHVVKPAAPEWWLEKVAEWMVDRRLVGSELVEHGGAVAGGGGRRTPPPGRPGR